MSSIAVVHLVWCPLGIEPLKRFLESYAVNKGGIGHDLIIAFKGFSAQEDLLPFYTVLDRANLPFKTILVPNAGFDMNSYFIVANQLEHERVCFLNSRSVIQDKDWLIKMSTVVSRPGVGLVGATGSYESPYSGAVSQFALKGSVRSRGLLETLRIGRFLIKYRYLFPPFPNPHIRSNAFMISTRLFRGLKCRAVETRMGALRFESGRNSMTRQILKKGLKTLIVGRDGIGYEPDAWWRSGTFRQGSQDNLLVADNRTGEYLKSTGEARECLAQAAWGALPGTGKAPSVYCGATLQRPLPDRG